MLSFERQLLIYENDLSTSALILNIILNTKFYNLNLKITSIIFMFYVLFYFQVLPLYNLSCKDKDYNNRYDNDM